MELTGRNILLLQGPMGPFFWWLARGLRARGATVHKVNFNGGDALFYPSGGISYRGSLEEWPAYFDALLQQKKIDEIVLFGDCRIYHRAAIAVARKQGVAVRVFEEGYIRPSWITLEDEGVNGHSRLPSNPDFYRQMKLSAREKPVQEFSHPFARMVTFTILYSLASWLWKWRYPEYRHHRSITPLKEARRWVRSAWRRYRNAPASKRVTRLAAGPLKEKYFLFPLQVHNDAQLLHHSPCRDKSKILDEVISSFARHAPEHLTLIVKHHPMDRAYRNYTACIRELARHHGVEGRVVYTWDAHLPTLLRYACGVVTVNSTVGLQALFHGVPVKVLGKAIYKIEGLTDPSPLQSFWHHPIPPDKDLYQRFRIYLLRTNQINGSFSYPPLPQLLNRWANLEVHDIREEAQESNYDPEIRHVIGQI